MKVTNGISTHELLETVVENAFSRNVVIEERYAKRIGRAETLKVLAYEKVIDGYDVMVDAPKGGIVVLNNYFFRFWKAGSGAEEFKIVPANGIHMAVSVPPGTRNMKVRYSRPLIREKIVELY